MRIWTLHPRLLDRAGLVACWRESLLAQKVLRGLTKGYTKHPQLERFRAHPDPIAAIGCYLQGLYEEASRRGYNFNAEKIIEPGADPSKSIAVNSGQVEYELNFLRSKILAREEAYLDHWDFDQIPLHPLFVVRSGPIEPWEKVG